MKSRVISASGWDQIVEFTDEESGLQSLIALHDTSLGPACGGVRVYPYESFEAGLEDVKNLSRGMTFKNALGGIPFGGGKAVVFADPHRDKTDQLIAAFARAVASLEGRYFTAADSGITEHDIEVMQRIMPYAAGLNKGGVGGDPSPFTARGVWRGMQAGAQAQYGQPTLAGLRVSILGAGAVGMELARLAHEDGATLVVADVNKAAVDEAVSRFGATAIDVDAASAADVDIFAPCALGGAIHADMIDGVKAKLIAGGANNQLKTPDMDEALAARGILYAPDYVINAAGVISIGLEILNEWSAEKMTRRIDAIGDTLREIFARAETEQAPTGAVADKMALEIISGC